MSTGLWEWWEALTRPQRDELMFVGEEAMSPDLARAVASAAGTTQVVRRVREVTGDKWRLTDQAARFVGDRVYERRHPDGASISAPQTVYSMSPSAPQRVELLYTEYCPNWETTAIRLSVALQVTGREGLEVAIIRIDTIEQAEAAGFTGSPMIRLDGVDPFDDPRLRVGLACRIYRDPDGGVGAPTVGQLVAVLLAYDR